jgi:hypothetical protein
MLEFVRVFREGKTPTSSFLSFMVRTKGEEEEREEGFSSSGS